MKRHAVALRIALLGGFEVHSAAGEPINLQSRSGKGLLAYLAMASGRAQARDKLATLLWEGSGAEQARASLRQTLSRLRRSLNVGDREILRGDGDTIMLDPSTTAVDALRFEELVGIGTPEALEAASGLYHGSFLEGFGPLAEPFEAWLMTERMRLHELAVDGLAKLLAYYQRAQATEDAIRVAVRLLTLDPLQEPVHRALMQLYVRRGRPRSARKQYELLCELLQRELGVAPEAETRKLAEALHAEPPMALAVEPDPLALHGGTHRQPVAGPVEQDFRRVEAQPDGRDALAEQAERRFVTLMSCSLADAAALSSRLDPEELRAVIMGFGDCCERVVSGYGGHISHRADHTITVCFGYPRADEHDAERAVRAGLDIVAAVGHLALLPGLAMRARVGIASGQVVIGKRIHEDGKSDVAITGETPHVVAGLQAIAEPDSVVVAESTKRLLGDLFEYRILCIQTLEGFDTPVRVWRVLGERPGQSRFAAKRGGTTLGPLIGRKEEIELLVRRWEQAKAGSGQVVVLAGEPGIGKSRLIEALREALTGEQYLHYDFYCSPHHQESALYPVIQQLEHAAGYTRDDPPSAKLDKLEALLAEATDEALTAVPLIADLLSIPTEDRYPPLNLAPHRQKEKTLQVLDAQLIGLTKRKPALMVFEDVHWSDPATREALERLVNLVRTLPVLMVVTHRPGTSIPRTGEPHVTSLVVKRLLRSESAALVENLAGEIAVPKEVLEQIVDKAEGVPLFLEELTKDVLESGILEKTGAPSALKPPPAAVGVPESLHDLLLARLDRLGPAKTAAQEAAVIGRRFPYDLLAAISTLNEPALRAALASLADAELVYAHGTPPHATYSFKHALVRDAAYASLLRADLRPLHERVANVLEKEFPETQETEPEVLAHHFAAAGLEDKAIPYFQKAGALATRRWAYREAVAYLDKALALLKTLPKTTERSAQELAVQVLLGQAWILTAGYTVPQVEAAFDRARALCDELGDSYQLFFVLLGLWQLYVARQELPRASATAERLSALAVSQHNRYFAIEAHVAHIVTLFTRGEFEEVLAHANQSIALENSEEQRGHVLSAGYDGRVISLTGASWALWTLGFPDQALKRMEEALATAQKLAHPYSQTMAFYCSAWLHVFRREACAAREQAEQAIALSIEHGFVWPQAFAAVLHGWALAEAGRAAEGIREIRESLAGLDQMGHALWRPHQQGLLAEACTRAGQIDEALDVVAKALESVGRTGDVEHAVELHRQQGELLLQQGAPGATAEAEKCFGDAIEIARRQKAKSWELRAAMSLARLWRGQGRRKEARKLLAPVYDWFTEGFDAPDLQDAKALLDTLV